MYGRPEKRSVLEMHLKHNVVKLTVYVNSFDNAFSLPDRLYNNCKFIYDMIVRGGFYILNLLVI